MNKEKGKRTRSIIRSRRTRAKLGSVSFGARLSVHRSLNHIYAQIIDDAKRVTLASASDYDVKDFKKGLKPVDTAFEVGKLLAQKAKEKKVERVYFDRGGHAYHGRVRALADGAREGGLNF